MDTFVIAVADGRCRIAPFYRLKRQRLHDVRRDVLDLKGARGPEAQRIGPDADDRRLAPTVATTPAGGDRLWNLRQGKGAAHQRGSVSHRRAGEGDARLADEPAGTGGGGRRGARTSVSRR